MSIDLSKVTAISDQYGSYAQIADASGRVLWELANDVPIVLEVAKQSITSYAGETSYSDNCVLLDIYPKNANSTVKVTYGGQSKILSFSGTNSKQVYFGTFNGVSDEAETPESGTLTIEGGCSGFACGVYQSSSKTTTKDYCSCITAVAEWGGAVNEIAAHAFDGCEELTLSELPDSIEVIGAHALSGTSKCVLTSLPSKLKKIENYGVHGQAANEKRVHKFTSLPNGLTHIGAYSCCGMEISIAELPPDVTYIGERAFYDCINMPPTFTIPSGVTHIGDYAFAQYDAGSTANYFENVTMLPITPPSLGSLTELPFGTPGRNFVITVPKGCGEAYKTAWSNYTDYIVEAS